MNNSSKIEHMIYLFHGSDTEKARTKARELFESLKVKKPDASFGELEPENLVAEKLQELTGGQGLFSNKCVVLSKGIFSDMEAREIAEPFIDEMATSPNIFIIAEMEPIKKILEKLKKKAAKSQEFVEKSTGEKEKWNDFAMANAIGSRKGTVAWKEYRKLVERDNEFEMIHGQIFWKFKQMILSPYGATAWKLEEIRAKSRDLARIYHEAHRGTIDFEIALETFLLKL